ncbi:hypothetical protein AA0242T_2530 [Acetobacter aceti NRIC 0242]|nr:hypothetical protein [Acetobacter aceti]GBO81828.1 hypothetical protein AA0242T_2530 [Acetobacter aceti NRIC 0242]
MNNIENEIFHDKNIFCLYKEARKYVVSVSNIIVSIFFGVSFFILSAIGLFLVHGLFDFSKIPSVIRTEVSLGISYTSSILGFLVSGFALFFALISKKEIKKLVYTAYPIKKNNEKKISCMRMTLYSFMYVFVHYALFLLLCLLVSLFFPEGGPLQYITTYIFNSHQYIMKITCLIFLSTISGWFIYIVMLLKSFIWNLYQSILLSIALGFEEDSV